MTRAVILYCAYGHVETMPEAVAEGARAAGAEVYIWRVTDLIPDKIARRSGIRPNKAAPAAILVSWPSMSQSLSALEHALGVSSSKMNNFLDQAVSLWVRDALVRMVGAAFISTARRQGGQEAAARHLGKRVAETAAKLAETSKLGENPA